MARLELVVPEAPDRVPADAVAVVGVACRLPGAADPGAFWHLLDGGRSAVGQVPAGRFPAGERPVRAGGFLDQVDRFDHEFFGLSAAEAAAADPQQRLVLELAWEALEDAGLRPEQLRGGPAGVFVGAIGGDYATLVARAEAVGRHSLTGLNRGIIANRVSYALDLRGPSLTVDSAQSSSLVAVHLAMESLRGGESELALAAGVNLNLAPDSTETVDRFGALSPDDRCYTFDARANGYARGEGAALLVLKPLRRAVEDGDRVYAVLLGSAVNSDGATDGLTVPSATAQAAVIRAAARRAGVAAERVQYVELHGTGTRVGDPIEAAGLGAALGGGREEEPLLVGSAKTNVGHLEGAAGIVGLLKTVLSVHHRRLPASLNFERPNPDIPFDRLGLRVRTESGPWPRPEQPLLAGVSSFGVGGTNAHVVVGSAVRSADGSSDSSAPRFWPLAARTPAALRAQAARLLDHLTAHPGLGDADLGFSLATTRTAFPHRAVATGADRAELVDALGALAAGEQHPGLLRAVAQPGGGGTVLVFPGQGSQWEEMARELLDTAPAFAAKIADCERALAPHTDWSLTAVLRGEPEAPGLDRVDVVQPVLFAVLVSLAALWQASGVRPDAVIGHSQGEIAAAHVAGALSLADAAAVVALRAKAIAGLARDGGAAGAMAAVPLPVATVRTETSGWGERIAVAAVNGPAATVVSGERAAVEAYVAQCREREVRARLVPVDYASHSPQVEPLAESLPVLLAGIRPRATGTAFYSTVTGGKFDTRGLTAEYWYRNLRQSVEFEAAVRAAAADGHRAFVESSPHPVLGVGLEQILDGAGAVTGTLRRDHGGLAQFHRSLAELHVRGGAVDWREFYGAEARRVPLPTYAFQRRRLWLDSVALPVAGDPSGDLLDTVLDTVALVLGEADRRGIDPDRSFKELGFDSVAAVEFRNRLAGATGLALPSTLTYDHPTASAVAEQLRALDGQLAAGGAPAREAVADGEREGDPVAIVAVAGRWPGGADTPEQLWELLRAGRDAIGPFPENRGWDLAALYDPEGLRPGSSYTRQGGFLAEADRFDGEFFGLSPRESAAMDPQQRVLLESAWELVERAGIRPAELRGSRTGVFVGVMPQEYGPRLHRTPESHQGHALTGTLTSVASGRIAYTLGLEGPAITIDTACSSSLVAIHLAAQALRSGECELALAGGATVMSTPGMFTEFSRQRGLAADGRCKPFAAAADGTAWAEGAGLVLLERLSDARRHGHQVLALVRGTAVNQDGASNGLTAPNGPAQQRVIRAALAAAGLRADQVDVVEAHGTGTALGDPIEAQALLATYGQDREAPFKLGSLKSNIGHTQAAAGVTGVIKLVQALHHQELPGTLHLDRPSPHVDWTAGAVELPTGTTPWARGERVRRGAVSSFGISGTNAHLILEEAPAEEVAVGEPGPAGPVPWLLSARTDGALREQAARLLAGGVGALDAAAVGHALATQRTAFGRRAVVFGGVEGLRELADGASGDAVVTGVAVARPRTAFLFSGQGSQRAGAGRELAARYPVFAAALGEVADLFDAERSGAVPLRSVLFAEAGSREAALLDSTEYTQPALFALQVALHRLAESFGVRPDLLIGHSIGELSAAHLAGVLSLPDAVRLVAARARLMQAAPGSGAMLAVQAAEEELLAELDLAKVGVAAVNGPRSVVVSGEREEVHRLAEVWRAQGRRTKPLQVSHAFHAPQMDAVLAEFRSVVKELAFAEPRVPVVSNRSGRVAEPGELTDPEYWVRHIRETVRFHQGVLALRESGATAYLELGPGAVLTALAAESLEGGEAVLAAALRADRAEPESFLTALARLQVHGAPVDFGPAFGAGPHPRVALPSYPFERRRHWLDQAAESDTAGTGLLDTGHPLLGGATELPDDGGWLLSGRIGLGSHPWLADHVVGGVVLLPGTAFLELAVQAAERSGAAVIEHLDLAAPLVLPREGAVRLQVVVGPAEETGRRPVQIRSQREGEGWTKHAVGTLAAEGDELAEPATTAADGDGASDVDPADVYRLLAERGYEYGPAFRGLTSLRSTGEGEVRWASAELADPEDGYALHPALVDALLQAVVLELEGTVVPFSFQRVTVRRSTGGALRARISAAGTDTVALDLFDAAGLPVARIGALTLRPVGRVGGVDAGYRLNWQAVGAAGTEPPPVPVVAPEDYAGAPVAAVPVTGAEEALAVLRRQRPGQTLVLLTRQAVATHPGEDVPDPAAAAVWGLARTAQLELPDQPLVLLDLDAEADPAIALPPALASGEPQLAYRHGELSAPRLTAQGTELRPPAGPWRLDTAAPGSLDSLALLPAPEAAAPLGPREVRLELRAAGLNFRDVLITLGMYPGGARFGAEGAGVVLETGAEVTGLRAGDRVMGLVQGTLGPVAVTDHRLLTPIPDGWSFAQAAGVPVAFLTAFHGLHDLAGLRAGETVLIHAATGGVGQAAVQLAQQAGAVVLGTASPGKWAGLREQGLPAARIASSRTLDFEAEFRAVTGGRGVDVVLNALAHEFTDASLRLLAPGGRFVELGKTDPRDPARVAAEHDGARYQAFDLFEVDPDRIRDLLAALAPLFASGALRPLPFAAQDVRQAVPALRRLSQARHTGKLVLTLPRALDPDGTVLITGGTGTLGALTARHLVERHGVRRLLLSSRQGPQAPGAAELLEELRALGAEASVVAADTADPAAVAALLAGIPAEHPLTAVLHTAGVLDDGALASLTPERLAAVARPKAAGARLLHQATAGLDLAAFVLFSSAVGLLGNPGQANYGAANAELDALAAHRRARGLPAVSLAWGHWAEAGGMAGTLGAVERERLAATGLAPMSTARALAQLDAALGDADTPGTAEALLATAVLDPAKAAADRLPAVLRGLVRPRPRPAGRGDGPAELRRRLAGQPEAERHRTLLALVRATAAAVLGHADPAAVQPEIGFMDASFDSLSVIELRNRLNAATGLQLPTTAVFDHPTPVALADHLRARLAPEPERVDLDAELDRLATALGALSGEPRESAVRRLGELLAGLGGSATPVTANVGEADFTDRISDVGQDEIFDFLTNELGIS
ncbi:type I polyketide synthase [Kitasatospora sp. NPDC006697]|uniref:type I polyketide synthase n=1 Tax=Kitasatospora sp. NPDC006697 TaxID=3364020 RepID=UPI003674A00D